MEVVAIILVVIGGCAYCAYQLGYVVGFKEGQEIEEYRELFERRYQGEHNE